MWLAVHRDGEYELAVVNDHEDDGDRRARRRGRLGGPKSNAPGARSIVGACSGNITPFPGSGASRQRFTTVVARGERGGTWRIGLRCAGRLRLKDISSGYHHYYRVAGANAGCAALGVDCLKRVGATVDAFVPDSGPDDIVNLHRVR